MTAALITAAAWAIAAVLGVAVTYVGARRRRAADRVRREGVRR